MKYPRLFIAFLIICLAVSCRREAGTEKENRTQPPAAAREIVEKLMQGEDRTADWTTLPGGVMFCDIVEGNGKSIGGNLTVFMNHRGYLRDGRKFVDTYKSDPVDRFFHFTPGKGEIIQGLEQGMSSMKERGKRVIVVPPDLAFGDQGMELPEVSIPPGETLIYEVSVMWVREVEEEKRSMFQ